MQSTVSREIVLASGPSTPALTDAVEHNGILYVAGYFSETVDRFDVASSVWLTPIDLGDAVTSLAVTGDTIIAGTLDDGLFLIENGTIRTNIPAGNNPDASTKYIVDIALTVIVHQQLDVKSSSSKNTVLIEQMLIQPLLGLLHSSHPIIS